ncbi:cysteine proteinase [Irpex rosettiformis]|uniref:Cysteine proteinase n=1 Tax=Irpex rosettiformis TaxID=378272 RepID=A0ACB8TWE7_9APHY|nr:cysteine proteinase [Irpex rosettiformis]
MPPKRLRRASPASQGLSAGERLKRTKLGHDQLAWAWVGTEVTNEAHITQEHRLATCGFSDSSIFSFCSNKYLKAAVKAKESPVADGELDDDIIVVSDDDTPNCSAKSCKNNPNCLNYLGQEKWENEEKARDAYFKASDLGPNPKDESRNGKTPVGLKNLGATCYANAFLQVWFQDIPFRTGVFNCQRSQSEEKLEESPIFQLQVTFAAMQSSNLSAFNPVKLVESLKLRTTEQQDAQEFSKLFMAHLDTEFKKQSDPQLTSLIADQFQGKQVYATICSQCHKRSEREAEFLEIEVNLANNAKLEERIEAMLEPETLNGDNQYFCSRCESLRDAQRQTELTELPPVLHFSLLRFVYDFTTMERKKSKQLISFPHTLDMSKYTTTRRTGRSVPEVSPKYHLRGILQHKGPSAYHGHYEAQIFDVATQAWYQFNDETVTKIDSLTPDAKAASKINRTGSQPIKPGKSQTKLKANSSKKKVVEVDSDIEILDGPISAKMHSPSTPDKTHISSRDAYMLIYARSPSSNESNGTQGTTTITCKRESASSLQGTIYPTLPDRALQVVQEIDARHVQSCEDYVLKLQDAENRFQNIRQRVMSIYRSWQLSNNAENSVVLSRKALERWLSHHLNSRSTDEKDNQCDEMEIDSGPTIFSSSDIVCEHGKLDPGEVSNMKRVTQNAFDRMVAEDECQFDPTLGPLDVCEECVKDSFKERLYQVEHPRLVSLFDEISSVEDDHRGYWVSKLWLKDWRLAKPKMHNRSREDPPPNDPEYESHVCCEHEGLTPNSMSRRRISQEAYEILKSLFPEWTTLSTDDEVCAVCEALIHISKEDKRGARIQAEEEKAKLKHMHDSALTGSIMFLEHAPCALVPAPFIRKWKQWLFRPAELPRPESIDNGQFICQHGLLVLNPNDADDLDNRVAVITRSDWDILQGLYPAGPLISLEYDGDQWTHSLDVCEECRKDKRYNFDVIELTVCILVADDPDPTPETYAARTSEKSKLVQQTLITYGSRRGGAVRQSKRIRQVKESGRKRKFGVLRNMTLRELKILIQDQMDIPTISQRLYYQGLELDDNEATIDSLGVLAGDSMDLREQAEDADLLDSNSESESRQRKRRREEGQGFEGTLLGNGGHMSSGHSSQHEDDPEPGEFESGPRCPACTFQNTHETLACAMCDTMFHSL